MGSYLQSLQAEQQQGEGKDGFGLGLSDSIGTISEGMGWLLNAHAGAMGAFPHLLEGLVSGNNLATIFGKSANPFGIKIFDRLLSGEEEGDGAAQQGEALADPNDFPYLNEGDGMSNALNGFDDVHDAGLHHGQNISPSSSPADFIKALEAKKDLIRIKEEVSTVLEMTEIHRRVLSQKGPAIIFENVVTENGRSSMPVLVNLFGTINRIALGLDINPQEFRDFGRLLAFLQSPEPPKSFRDAIKMVPLLKTVLSMRNKVVKNAPCQEIVLTGDEVDLRILPIQTCWPNEPAPLITWPLVVTKGPTNEKQDGFNLGIYRLQVIDKKTTLMRWLAHRDGASHHKRWKEKGGAIKFPAAAVIGTDPVTIIAAGPITEIYHLV
ncbi:UbiD decarboxylyase family,FMN-binding split barrel [Cinara cedri]|uniref:UbiD decarboxylyase family,FMN-binding split barrel n=1 Tax=Cinara cedri TaxID=506608 RepID=A0A5E4NDA9_9HEMI|nr:UbiD decarboxylyase family,FMN-binding split barrel [Cinara cedri]